MTVKQEAEVERVLREMMIRKFTAEAEKAEAEARTAIVIEQATRDIVARGDLPKVNWGKTS